MKEYLKLMQGEVRGSLLFFQYFLAFHKDSERQIFHRENDKPAFIRSDGGIIYYKNGEFIKHERISQINTKGSK